LEDIAVIRITGGSDFFCIFTGLLKLLPEKMNVFERQIFKLNEGVNDEETSLASTPEPSLNLTTDHTDDMNIQSPPTFVRIDIKNSSITNYIDSTEMNEMNSSSETEVWQDSPVSPS
jgi:hypothetical protein